MSKAVIPEVRVRCRMDSMGRVCGEVLNCVLNVAVPRMRGGRRVERGGWVGGMVGVRCWCM